MTRGRIFHVTTDLGAIGDMSAEDFRGTDMGRGVSDDGPDEAGRNVERFRHGLAACGAVIAETYDPGGAVRPAFTLRTGDKFHTAELQKEYFREKFKAARSALDGMDLAAFSTDPLAVAGVARSIEDRFGDAVYLDMGTGPALYTMDGFMRRLVPDTAYYVAANTIAME